MLPGWLEDLHQGQTFAGDDPSIRCMGSHIRRQTCLQSLYWSVNAPHGTLPRLLPVRARLYMLHRSSLWLAFAEFSTHQRGYGIRMGSAGACRQSKYTGLKLLLGVSRSFLSSEPAALSNTVAQVPLTLLSKLV